MSEPHMSQERRGLGRQRVMFAAKLHRGGAASDVRVMTVSPDGVMLVGTDLPPRNARVDLNRNGKSASGRIAWISHGRAGVQLDGASAGLTMLRRVAAPKPMRVEVCKRPSLRPVRLSRAEQASIERCALLLGTSIVSDA